MEQFNRGIIGLDIRSEKFQRRTARRVMLSLLGYGVVAGLLAGLARLVEHHWPDVWAWVAFFGTTLAIRVGYAYRELVALLERQNALLERLLLERLSEQPERRG